MCYILQALNFQHFPLPKPPRYAPFLLECHKRTATHALWLLLFLLQLPAKCIYLLWGGISGYRNHRVGWPGHPFWSQSGLILKSLGLSGCPPNMEILHWPGKQQRNSIQIQNEAWHEVVMFIQINCSRSYPWTALAHGLPTSSSNSSGTSPANCKVWVMSVPRRLPLHALRSSILKKALQYQLGELHSKTSHMLKALQANHLQSERSFFKW